MYCSSNIVQTFWWISEKLSLLKGFYTFIKFYIYFKHLYLHIWKTQTAEMFKQYLRVWFEFLWIQRIFCQSEQAELPEEDQVKMMRWRRELRCLTLPERDVAASVDQRTRALSGEPSVQHLVLGCRRPLSGLLLLIDMGSLCIRPCCDQTAPRRCSGWLL